MTSIASAPPQPQAAFHSACCFTLPSSMDPCSNSSPSHSFKGFRSDADRPLRNGGGGSIRLKDQNRTAASPPPSSSRERDNAAGFSSSFRVLIDQDANDDEDVETRETKLWRGFRSKCFGASCSDKDDAACDESSERGRSSLRRKAPGYEKYISIKTLASERERPDGTRKLPDSDRESLDRFNTMRLSVGRRSRGNDHHRRQATPEHSNNSLLREESDHAGMVVSRAVRKGSGFDKKSGSDGGGNESSVGRDLFWKGSPGSQEEHSAAIRDESDIQRGSSILNRNEAKIPAKGSPRRDYGLDKNGTRTLLKEKIGADEQRIPLKKAFKTLTEMEEELVDKVLPNSKGRTGSREPEQGVKSGEIDTRTWSRRSSSKTSGGELDDVKDGNSSQATGNNEEWRWNSHDFLFKFSHITKRVRSDRDRGRREELANKRVQREDRGDKLEAAGKQKVCSVEKQDLVAAAEVDEATNGINLVTEARAEGEADAGFFSKNADVTVLQSEERESDRLEGPLVPGSSSTQVEKVEIEEREGNLAVEDSEELYNIRLAKARAVDIGGGKEGKDRDNEVPADATVGEEACEGVNQEAFEEERHKNRDGVASHKVPAEFNSVGELGEPKMMRDMEEKHWGTNEEKTNLQVQYADGIASTSIALERHDSLKGGLTLDFPEKGTLEKEKHAKQDCADKGSSKELTLSLFMKPAAAKVEGSELKGHAIESRSGLNEEFESGKHLQSARSMQARKSQHGLGGFGEGVSDHSAYGHKQKKLKMESLQLSLALPGTSMAAAGSNHPHAAGPVEPERSFQSLTHTQTQTQNLSQSKTHTNSDGFTTSLSLSQSHSFIHNPSCSLNCTSLENQELSCGGSRQLSQDNEQLSQRSWQTASGNEQMLNGTLGFTSLSQDRSKHRRRIPLYQLVLQNGNMQSSPSVTGSNRSSGNNHVSHRSHHFGQKLQVAPKILDSSSQDLEDAGRPDSTRNDFPVRFRQQAAAWLASNQPAAQETRSESQAQWEGQREGDYSAPPAKRYSSVRSEGVIGGRNVPREIIGLYEIATEPVAVMAQKMQELPDNFLEGLKGLAKEVLGSFEKREEFITLQDKIRKRMDLTEHTLLHAHRTQLEILVALKTGMQAFVQEGTKPHTYKVLTEIFLQTRCRNIACKQSLPVYGCECRICSQKSGFCHDCMCVVCFKFDSDNRTCRWVGCDVCMHWCHTDCGLRLSYIAPAQSIQGAAGTTEMQFRCVACDHHSELFGFVKAVFHKCANSWGAETLTKELDCVRRIFHGSEDMRGKQLCWKAEAMLHKLENNVETAEVRRSMLSFLNGGNAELDGACTGAKKGPPPSKPIEASDRTASAAREATFQVASNVGNKLTNLDKARVSLQTNDRKLAEKRTETAELQYDRARKRAEIEEIESVVRMKEAEAKMFQVRADEAHQEASGLQRIISVKQEKIEEDYACKYAKLRLNEAEEKKRKRLEELQALERAELDYQKMKLRMEAQIKDLLMKMELTKLQYA